MRALALVVGLVLSAAPPASASSSRDTTGRVVTGFDLRRVVGDQSIGALVVGADGVITAAGTSGAGHRLTLARYTQAGGLDPSYADGGIATLSVPGRPVVQNLLRRPDGRFVAVVSDQSPLSGRVGLIGITSAGALDASFGSGGIASLPAASLSCAGCHSAAMDPGGGVISAVRRAGRPALMRVTAAGSLDDGFGSGGFAQLAGVAGLDAVAVDPEGDIFALGESADGAHTALVRFSASGIPRGDYGSGGIVTIPEDTFGDLLTLGAGRVLAIAGRSSRAATTSAVVRRYLADGSVDPAYGTSGATTMQIADRYPQLLAGSQGGADVVASVAGAGGQIVRLDSFGSVRTAARTIPEGFGGGAFSAPARSPVTVTFGAQRAPQPSSFVVGAAAERPDGGIVLGGDAAIFVDDGGAGLGESGSWGLQSLRPDLSFDPAFGAPQPVRASVRLRHVRPRTASRSHGGVPVTVSLEDRGEIELTITTRRGGRTIIVAHRTAVFLAAKTAHLRIPATHAGSRLLRNATRVRLTVSARATIVGGQSRMLQRSSLTEH